VVSGFFIVGSNSFLEEYLIGNIVLLFEDKALAWPLSNPAFSGFYFLIKEIENMITFVKKK
jgi:hypothetical protein